MDTFDPSDSQLTINEVWMSLSPLSWLESLPSYSLKVIVEDPDSPAAGTLLSTKLSLGEIPFPDPETISERFFCSRVPKAKSAVNTLSVNFVFRNGTIFISWKY